MGRPTPKFKRNGVRRRRLDFECGCSAYVKLDCRHMGFTHGGVTQCASIQQWRLYLDDKKSPIFQGIETLQQALWPNDRRDTPSSAIQQSSQKTVESTQMLDNFSSLDDLTASDLALLESLDYPMSQVP